MWGRRGRRKECIAALIAVSRAHLGSRYI
jgi:hypothetical protein